jgi:plastocyanin
MRQLILVFAMASGLVAASVSTVAAQDASPAASPMTAICEAPGLPPGTPTPMEEIAPEGTPAGDMASLEMGTPEAVEEVEAIAEMAEQATPEMAAPLEGEMADEATAERVIAAAENLITCLSSGDYLGFAALSTPNYLLTEFGTSNPYDLPLYMEGFPSIEGRAATDAQTHADGRVSVDLTTVIGGTQVDRFRAYFVEENGTLLLDEEQTLPVEGADVTIEATMIDFAFDLSQDTVPADTLVAFTLPNEGQYPHELAIVRLPEGITVEQVLADPALEDQVQFIGGAYAEPGETGHFALEGLEPGTYTAVCFVDVPDGIPHVMRGMVAELTVE